MILWNTSSKPIESKYDGVLYAFAPDERKRVNDEATYKHLVFKLEAHGLVAVDEMIQDKKELEAYRVKGLRNRRAMLDQRVRQFNTMNKERVAQKLSEMPADEVIMDTCDELEAIDKILSEVDKERLSRAEKYLNSSRQQQADEKIEGSGKADLKTPAAGTAGRKAKK